MTVTTDSRTDLLSDEMLARFDERAPSYDRTNSFFTDDFEELRACGFFTATLPAEYGRTQPELAAAGLYHAAAALDKLKDDRGAVAVRYELTTAYASTQYAARLRNESKPEP